MKKKTQIFDGKIKLEKNIKIKTSQPKTLTVFVVALLSNIGTLYTYLC